MILVCGASGLVGSEFCRLLEEDGINYIGTYNTRKIDKPNMFKIDFSNVERLENFLIYHGITCCVFCVVERMTDICETNWEHTKKTNIDLVDIVSYACNLFNIKFIHLSTDYVFDGSTQPNLPEDRKNPLQNYGISKLMSELRVIKNCNDYCIIRTPVLYSNSPIHENAVCLLGKHSMDLRDKIHKEDHYSIRRPLYVIDLCFFIKECIYAPRSGIYHFYNPHHTFTKYEISNFIGKYLDLSTDKIVPVDKSEGYAPRPFDTQLIDPKLSITNYTFHSFQYTIETCFSKFKHPKINSPTSQKSDFFICLDLDDTILDSNQAHYNAYKNVFKRHDKPFLNMNEWNDKILNGNIDTYLSQFSDIEMDIIKSEKRIELEKETIQFTKNSEHFLQWLMDNDMNFCIVTNTNEKTAELFKSKLPLLKKIKQWIYRDNYTCPKPNPECYHLAKQKYYKNEPYIIGFEDSLVGYTALKSITSLIYIYKNEELFKKKDCYLFDDYMRFSSGNS